MNYRRVIALAFYSAINGLRVRNIVLLSVTGFILSVAIPIGTCLYAGREHSNPNDQDGWSMMSYTSRTLPAWLWRLRSSIGHTRVDGYYLDPECPGPWYQSQENIASFVDYFDYHLPDWVQFPPKHSECEVHSIIVGYGFPFRSFVIQVDGHVGDMRAYKYAARYVASASGFVPKPLGAQRIIANAIFWIVVAIFAYSIYRILLTLWRYYNNLCTVCAYPIGQSGRCSECGSRIERSG